jgi:serine/threonine-protein kinase
VPVIVGRYAIFDAIAAGGMATVHLGRLIGPVGFSRTVAIKRLHAQYAHDPDFTSMFLDEARMAARVQHPNVVPTLDVVLSNNELLLVMEYVRGESLSRLIRAARTAGERMPPRIVVAILSGALQGLHAAHEATDEKGKALGLVHRDMTPQNILIGVDGTARVLDFGVAKAEGRVQTTREGQVKGKLLYMPPEQLAAQPVSRTADVYAAGVVLFEALTGTRMFAGEDERASISRIMSNDLRVPSDIVPELSAFDAVVRRACSADPTHRFPSAREMALALEECMTPASNAEVGSWVERLASGTLNDRARKVAEIESSGMSVAGITRTSNSVKPAKPSNRRWLLAAGIAGGVVLLGSLLTTAYLLGTRSDPSQPALVAKPIDSEPAVAATSTAKPPVTAVESTAAPTASVVPSVTASVTASAKAKPVTAIQQPAANHCDPPYVMDKSGHKHFLPECMK